MTRKLGFVSGAVVASALLAGTLLAGSVAAQTAPGPGWGPGIGPMMGGSGRMGGPGIGPMADGDEHAAVAQALGISTQELWTLRASGKSIAQIAQDKGVPLDQVTAAIIQAHKDDLAERVQAGTLTQAQADAWLAAMQTRVQAMVQATGVGPMGGMMGFRGRGPGAGPGFGMGFGPGSGPRWATPTPTP